MEREKVLTEEGSVCWHFFPGGHHDRKPLGKGCDVFKASSFSYSVYILYINRKILAGANSADGPFSSS